MPAGCGWAPSLIKLRHQQTEIVLFTGMPEEGCICDAIAAKRLAGQLPPCQHLLQDLLQESGIVGKKQLLAIDLNVKRKGAIQSQVVSRGTRTFLPMHA